MYRPDTVSIWSSPVDEETIERSREMSYSSSSSTPIPIPFFNWTAPYHPLPEFNNNTLSSEEEGGVSFLEANEGVLSMVGVGLATVLAVFVAYVGYVLINYLILKLIHLGSLPNTLSNSKLTYWPFYYYHGWIVGLYNPPM
jgi:hypothetical protein